MPDVRRARLYKQQSRRGVETDGFALSPPHDASLGQAFLGADQKSIHLRPLTSYGNSSCLTMLASMPPGRPVLCRRLRGAKLRNEGVAHA